MLYERKSHKQNDRHLDKMNTVHMGACHGWTLRLEEKGNQNQQGPLRGEFYCAESVQKFHSEEIDPYKQKQKIKEFNRICVRVTVYCHSKRTSVADTSTHFLWP